MKAQVKDQWVKDLRSGEFEQGVAYLRVQDDPERFCCLGVLCEQAVKAGAIPAPELHGDSYLYLDDKYEKGEVTGEEVRQECALPRKVAEWAGISTADRSCSGYDVAIEDDGTDGRLTAIGANDGAGLSFAQIADLIEKNVPAE